MQYSNYGTRTAETVPLADAAKLLDISYFTAWTWAKAGRFEGLTRTGSGRIRIPISNILSILAKRQVSAGALYEVFEKQEAHYGE